MTAAVVVIGALAGLTATARWLRVSQREHYLPWSVAATAKRWASLRPPNLLLVPLWLALLLGAVLADGGVAAGSGIAAALLGAAWPVGLSLVGSPPLRLTRRAAMQGATSVLLGAAASLAIGAGAGAAVAAGIAPALATLAVDVGAWVNAPLERRIAGRFRRAADERLRRTRPRVVAVTGSYGKTTVKNHIRDLVGTTFDTLATPASWNNVAGLSRAINEHLTPSTEVFVAEMGTYGPGEIREMVTWLRPEVAVITALGPVHLERMKTIETILAAKAEILEGARCAVLATDHPLLRRLGQDLRDRADGREVWLVGSDPSADLDVAVTERRAEPDDAAELVVRVRGEELGTVTRGSLHPSNVACAVATALALGVDRRVVVKALPKLTSASHRSSVATTDAGVVIVDDTFNSNPDGAVVALTTLTRRAPTGRRYVVTPGMVELGGEQFEANKAFAEAVAASGATLVAVGWTNRRALLAGHPGAVTVKDRAGARAWLSSRLERGDGVLWENDLPDHYP